MFCVVVGRHALLDTKRNAKIGNWQMNDWIRLVDLNFSKEVRILSHSQTFILSDGEAVTTEREKKLQVGDSLQTWWDNEVRPGAPRLAVRIFHCATNATWQLAAVACFRLGCTACLCPSPFTPFHQHMACCLLDHHHHCRAIVLAPSRSISFCHPPYLQYVPSFPTLPHPLHLSPSLPSHPSPLLPMAARSRPHTWRGYVTELRSWAVLSWHE